MGREVGGAEDGFHGAGRYAASKAHANARDLAGGPSRRDDAFRASERSFPPLSNTSSARARTTRSVTLAWNIVRHR